MNPSQEYRSYRYSYYFNTDLPAHWIAKHLCHLAKQHKTSFVDGPFGSDLKSSDYQSSGVPLIQLNNIRDGKHFLRNMKFVTEEKKEELSRHVAVPGDIVIAKMAEPVARSAVVASDYVEYVIVDDCIKMTPDLVKVDLSFLIWAINSDVVRINAELVSTGTTRIRISLGDLKKLKIPYPPLLEQKGIANFLDHETAKIDTLIEEQKTLIRLLQEKRQAVISHAVTKGLNPDVPLKDSGVEWLGQVPEHWQISPLKYLVQDTSGIQMGPFGGMLKELEYVETGFKLYGQENTISGDFSKGTRWLTQERYNDLSNYNLENGDIVLTRKGSLGNARLIDSLKTPGVIDSDTIRVRVNLAKLNGEFLSLLMHEAHYIAEQIQRTHRGSVLPGLNSETISNLKIMAPPLMEQNELMIEIKKLTKFYDHSLDECFLRCDLLAERRTALISAAVTGKIDVRDWVAPTQKQPEAAPCN